MKPFITTLVIAIGIALTGYVAFAADSDGDANAKQTVEKKKSTLPVFVPRERGAPATRIGGATRGAGQAGIPFVDALAPDQVGFTLDAEPVLYWYISHASEARVDFTLRVGEEIVVERTLPSPKTPGVQRIALADFDVTLEPDRTYIWFVSLIPDVDRRSEDRIAGGAIERLNGTSELTAQLAAETDDRHVFVFAEAGLWYDAVHAVSDRIDGTSDDEAARAQRTALLEQVGLEALARRERGES
jgi:hypothetical protein